MNKRNNIAALIKSHALLTLSGEAKGDSLHVVWMLENNYSLDRIIDFIEMQFECCLNGQMDAASDYCLKLVKKLV
jgi:hypothetical protein